jgi:hypothetical protein
MTQCAKSVSNHLITQGHLLAIRLTPAREHAGLLALAPAGASFIDYNVHLIDN